MTFNLIYIHVLIMIKTYRHIAYFILKLVIIIKIIIITYVHMYKQLFLCDVC